MSTFTAFLVAFFASFGAPVHHCNGTLVWGHTSCDQAAPPPPDATIVVEEHHAGAPRQISNGL